MGLLRNYSVSAQTFFFGISGIVSVLQSQCMGKIYSHVKLLLRSLKHSIISYSKFKQYINLLRYT